MPRYVVERTFSDQIALPGPHTKAQALQTFIENNALDGVTWVHSYVVADKRKSFGIYEALTPEALRRAARRNGLLVDRIPEVRVLDPCCHIA